MFWYEYTQSRFNVDCVQFAISANGNGANMIVTFDEPIV